MADSNYKRYSWLDILKGFGIIFVVLGHFCSIDSVYHWTYSFHMPLFFLASGYLYRKRSVMSTIKHKFLTLMVPYFLFGIITSIYYVLNEFIFAREVNFSELVLGLLYGTYSSIVYNKVLWFLPVLFCISVIYNMLKVGWGGAKVALCSRCNNNSLIHIRSYTMYFTMGNGLSGMPLYDLLYAWKYTGRKRLD